MVNTEKTKKKTKATAKSVTNSKFDGIAATSHETRSKH